MKTLRTPWRTETAIVLWRGSGTLEFTGVLSLGLGTMQLRAAIEELLSKRYFHIRIDMRRVTRIDVAALATLVSLKAMADVCGAELELLGLRVDDLSVLVKLIATFGPNYLEPKI